MIKETQIQGQIEKAVFLYMGTEIVTPEELMKLTGGKGLEIIAETEGRQGHVKIVLNLRSSSDKSKKTLAGTFTVKWREHPNGS